MKKNNTFQNYRNKIVIILKEENKLHLFIKYIDMYDSEI